MQARVRLVRCARNPLRRSCASSARNAGESAIESARAQGRTFGNGWSVGLELVREESDQWRKAWRVERTSLCSFIGMVAPAFVCMASAIASKSNRLSRISCKRWVVKTDSATLLVGMSPQNLP